MSDPVVSQIYSLVQIINNREKEFPAIFANIVQTGLDKTENIIIDSVQDANGVLLFALAESESNLSRLVSGVEEKTNTALLNIQQLDDFVQNQIFPALTRLEISTDNIENLTLEMVEKIDSLPGEVAKEVSKLFGDNFERIAKTFEDFILLFQDTVNNQTEVLKESINLGLSRLNTSIDEQTAAITAQMNTMRAGLVQAIDEGNADTVKVLGTITTTLDAKLTALTESQADMSNAVILFLSEFWTNAKSFWNEMNGVNLSMVQKTMELGEELNSQVVRNIKSGETPVITDDREILAFLASEMPYG